MVLIKVNTMTVWNRDKWIPCHDWSILIWILWMKDKILYTDNETTLGNEAGDGYSTCLAFNLCQ